MQYKFLIVSALAGLASAYYQPDTAKYPTPTGNDIHSPLAQVVPGGQDFQITWTPTTQGKVSIIMLQGPGKNVQYYRTIADSIDNSGSYTWHVPTDIPPKDTNYAIEIISENGSYQYSPQMGISQAPGYGSTTDSVTSYGAVETAPPSSGAEGTAHCGAEDIDDPACSKTSAPTETSTSAVAVVTAPTGSGNISSPVVAPTGPLTVPSSMATVAQPEGKTSTSIAVIGVTPSGGAAPASTGVSTALAAPGAKLSGVAAVVAGLLGLLAL